MPAGQREPDAGPLQVEVPAPIGGHGPGRCLGGGEVCGGVVERAVEHAVRREHERQLCVLRRGLGGEGGQERVDGRLAAVEAQADRALGEQPGRVRPVLRRLGMANRIHGIPVLLVPLRGLSV